MHADGIQMSSSKTAARDSEYLLLYKQQVGMLLMRQWILMAPQKVGDEEWQLSDRTKLTSGDFCGHLRLARVRAERAGSQSSWQRGKYG